MVRYSVRCLVISILFPCLLLVYANPDTGDDEKKEMRAFLETSPLQCEHAKQPAQRSRLTFTSVVSPPPLQNGLQTHGVHPHQSTAQPAWLSYASINNAPALVKGICNHIKAVSKYKQPTACQWFILVGQPGTGKTTLARAIAWYLERPIEFIQAPMLLGQYRNETAINIRAYINKCMLSPHPLVLVIDELHKLFERHADGKTDHAENAATFWLMLDELEKKAPHIVIIGTANSISGLPPELKSRMCGKIITMNMPTRKQQIQAFKDIAAADASIQLDTTINDSYISTLLDRAHKTSLRDVRLLLETAKMFTYAHENADTAIAQRVLRREHFEQAVTQLQAENMKLQSDILDAWTPKIKQVALLLTVAVNCGVLSQMVLYGLQRVSMSRGVQ